MNETVANQGISLLPGRNQRLSARLLLYVVLISSAFTLVVTAFQLYLDFQRDIRTVHESVDFIQESYLPALAQSAYDLDDRQMRSLLEGALKLPDIVYLEVVEVDAGGERLLAARGDTDAPRDIYETFALPYPNAPAGTPQQAELRVAASLQGIYQRLWHRALILLGSNAIKTFFASLCIFAVIQFMITRHLQAMAAYTQGLNLESLSEPLQLSRDRRDDKPDELDQVVTAINEMRRRMQEDIEQRDEAEARLRENEENLRITLDSIGDAVITTDREGLVTGLNPVAAELTGWTEDDAFGEELQVVLKLRDAESRERLPTPVAEIVDNGEVIGLHPNALLEARGGTERRIADSGAPIRNRDGDIVGVVLVFRDVTEQKQLEEQLQHARRMDSIGQLAGGVAHDFNNMLGGIVGAAELLEDSVNDDEGREMVKLIVDTSQRAADLTRKLLAFSRKGKIQSTAFDLHTVIDDALALLSRTIDRRIEIIRDLAAAETSVRGDPTQLQNVVLNICLNARDAMPDGGELTIATKNKALDPDYCRSSTFELEPGNFIEITIRDTGTGMDEQTRTQIFEPFFTTKEVGHGTGLGLSAVYGTVQDHHGAVTVYSEPGKGTVFHVYLPTESHDQTRLDDAERNVTRGSGCVLVVDDEQVIRKTAMITLQALGYSVLLAADGEEGLAVYRDKHRHINAVILDVIMPKMDGQTCLREIRRINPAAVVLMASGFTGSADAEELRDLGINGFLEKPFRRAELSRALEAALRRDR